MNGGDVERGGGIYLSNASPKIKDNVIRDNSASDHGGGIYCYKSNPTITDNTITDNSAPGGGGINCFWSNPTIQHNTIAGNSADSLGDGIYCIEGSFPVVDSNNIYNNGWGVYNTSAQILLAKNNWLGDTVSNYVDFIPWLGELVGMEEMLDPGYLSLDAGLEPNFPHPFRHCDSLFVFVPVESSFKSLQPCWTGSSDIS